MSGRLLKTLFLSVLPVAGLAEGADWLQYEPSTRIETVTSAQFKIPEDLRIKFFEPPSAAGRDLDDPMVANQFIEELSSYLSGVESAALSLRGIPSPPKAEILAQEDYVTEAALIQYMDALWEYADLHGIDTRLPSNAGRDLSDPNVSAQFFEELILARELLATGQATTSAGSGAAPTATPDLRDTATPTPNCRTETRPVAIPKMRQQCTNTMSAHMGYIRNCILVAVTDYQYQNFEICN
jgi:hypothetical protein